MNTALLIWIRDVFERTGLSRLFSGMTQLALMEIDALWAIARARYVGTELTGVHVVTPEALADGITGAFADAGGINSFSTTVAVEITVDTTTPTRPPAA